MLTGWIKFVYESEGEHTFHAGNCILQPPAGGGGEWGRSCGHANRPW